MSAGGVRVNTRMWSAIVEQSANQQIPSNAGDIQQVIAQVHVPIVWRVSVRSSLPLSPVPAQVTAELYGAGGVLKTNVAVVDGQEFVATGIALYLPPLAVGQGEQIFLAVAPVEWPHWLTPVLRSAGCGCGS